MELWLTLFLISTIKNVRVRRQKHHDMNDMKKGREKKTKGKSSRFHVVIHEPPQFLRTSNEMQPLMPAKNVQIILQLMTPECLQRDIIAFFEL